MSQNRPDLPLKIFNGTASSSGVQIVATQMD
jgi:hypothetical protein